MLTLALVMLTASDRASLMVGDKFGTESAGSESRVDVALKDESVGVAACRLGSQGSTKEDQVEVSVWQRMFDSFNLAPLWPRT